MSRDVKNHDNGPVKLDIIADELGAGGASHVYTITAQASTRVHQHIKFQQGGVEAHGVNGITHEALLSIVLDRLECFQEGPFPNDYNAAAAMNIAKAIEHLNERTSERINRGVEGQELP